MTAELPSSSSSPAAPSDAEVLQRLHDELEAQQCLAADDRASLDHASFDLPSLAAKGTGPRLFCGHVPKEVNDDMVRQHFSKWGTVNDVYFPRHKKTLKRRPFCFVTFANKEDAQRALSESGLEIGGVAIKNLTMVEDRDKYYTNKHATARQALLQALKQLGPSAAAAPPNGTSANASALPSVSNGGITSEQLSNLAAIMALEGVHSDVVLQSLGLPAMGAGSDAGVGLPPVSTPMPGLDAATLASLDSATLLQALASPALSSQSAFDVCSSHPSVYDMRSSFDLSGLRSTGNSLDLSSLHHSLAAAAAASRQLDRTSHSHSHMHTADSRSTLASADWSRPASARTSLDASLLPVATAGFLASAASLGSAGSISSMQTRMSLDAALQYQHAQQQAALLANTRLSAPTYQPLPPATPMSSVMHSGFYQPAAAPAPPQQQPEAQHSLQTIMQSGLYGGGPPAPPPPARHSMHEFAAGAGSLLPFSDPTWTPQQQQQQLGGCSALLRPSIDRAGLPPLPPRSPNQDVLGRPAGSTSPDTLLGLANGGWPLSGRATV